MSSPTQPSPTPSQSLAGILWVLSGLLATIGTGLLAGVAWAILAGAAWCAMTSVAIGRRR